MSTIVTRAGKGSALTHTEVDANFTNLNTDKVEKTGTDPVVISVNTSGNALLITQTGTGNALVVEDSANPDSTPFVVNADGIVVSGNTAALPNVSSASGSRFGAILTSASSAFGAYKYSADTGSSIFDFSKSRSTTIGSYTVVASGDTVGEIRFAGDDGTAFVRAAVISAAVDGTPGTNDMPGRLVFSTTADGASSPTERMRIGSDGGVGIGASNAAGYKLLVAGTLSGATSSFGIASQSVIQSDVTSSARLFRSNVNTAASAFTIPNVANYWAGSSALGAGSAITNLFGFQVDSTLTTATNNYGFYSNIASGTGRWNFYANGTADNYFAGNVGIGTSSPGSALDVKGTLRLSGATSGYVGFAPAAAAGSTTYTLPSADGTSGQFLSTNGSGTLSWGSGGGASISQGNSNVTVTDAGTGKIEFNVDAVEVADFTTAAIVFNESGANQDFRVEGDTVANLFVVDASADHVGIGTSAPSVLAHIQETSGTTNAVTQVLRLDSQSSGTPANGIGVGMQFATETAAGNTEIGATIEAITTDVTAASEDFDLSFKTMAAGAAAAERARIKSTGDFQFNSGYGSVATAYGCRAWVNFNGTGTVAIRASGNVSSITDNGTGDYTVNFATAMPDANCSVAGSAKEADSGTTDTLFKIVEVASNPSASNVRVMTGGPSTAWDSTVVMVSVFR